MARPRRTPRALAANRGDRLDRANFDFIENLLVFRSCRSRAVPAESGVCFQIAPIHRSDAICLLYRIDHPTDPLISDGPRPDYAVFHASKAGCICTIIEMKGRDEKKLGHGIDQIKALRDRLQRELRTHISPAFARAVHYQGILLTPQNSQLPFARLDDEAKRGLVILPLQYHHQAELAPYIGRRLAITERYRHEKHRRDAPEFNYVERIFVDCPLPVRWGTLARHQPGVALSFARPDGAATAHASLVVTHSERKATFDTADYRDRVQDEIERLALPTGRLRFCVEGE